MNGQAEKVKKKENKGLSGEIREKKREKGKRKEKEKKGRGKEEKEEKKKERRGKEGWREGEWRVKGGEGGGKRNGERTKKYYSIKNCVILIIYTIWAKIRQLINRSKIPNV